MSGISKSLTLAVQRDVQKAENFGSVKKDMRGLCTAYEPSACTISNGFSSRD